MKYTPAIKGVIAGALCHAAIISLFQDYLGLERYIEFCRKHWNGASVTIPFALGLLVGAVYLYLSARSVERRKNGCN
jgi:hypothetical protein